MHVQNNLFIVFNVNVAFLPSLCRNANDKTNKLGLPVSQKRNLFQRSKRTINRKMVLNRSSSRQVHVNPATP